jgi:hypothetical protein
MSQPAAGFNANPQNINRKGAPKKEFTMSRLLEDVLNEEYEVSVSYKEMIAKRLILMASKGHMGAIKEIMNRMDGKPKQMITNNTNPEILIEMDEILKRSEPTQM